MEKEFFIRHALVSDAAGIAAVMEAAVRTAGQPDWFVADRREDIVKHLEQQGLAFLAQAPSGEAAGFLMVHIPGLGPENLGRDLELPESDLPLVAHMESIAVLPRYRGNRLQARLLAAAEEALSDAPYRYYMATVHPENRYSVRNFTDLGYEIAATVKKYGGLDRHILRKQKRTKENTGRPV